MNLKCQFFAQTGCPALKPVSHMPHVPTLSYQPSILSTLSGSGVFSMLPSTTNHLPLLTQLPGAKSPTTLRPNKIISSPIRVPIPPTPMSSQFSSLAQYLSSPKGLVDSKSPDKTQVTNSQIQIWIIESVSRDPAFSRMHLNVVRQLQRKNLTIHFTHWAHLRPQFQPSRHHHQKGRGPLREMKGH